MSPRPVAASPTMSAASKKTLPAAKANANKLCSSNKPKRPLSAYNLFFQHERDRLLRGIASPFGYSHNLNHCTLGRKPSVRADRSKKVRPPPHGKIGFAQLAKTVGANWKSLDDKGKKYFEDRAAKEKARYSREIEIWKRKGAEGFVASSLLPPVVGTPPSSSLSPAGDPPTASPTAVVAPPSTGTEDGRLPPLALPPKSVGYNQHEQQYSQYYYNNDSTRGGAPPPPALLGHYAPHQPPREQQQAEHGWFVWNAAPQLSSMTFLAHSGPSYSYQAQQQQQEEQLSRNSFGLGTYYHGESYDGEAAATHNHDQQQQPRDSERNCHGGEDFFNPLPQITEPNPLPERPSTGRIVSNAQPSSFAIDNPSDVLDFLAKFVCDT